MVHNVFIVSKCGPLFYYEENTQFYVNIVDFELKVVFCAEYEHGCIVTHENLQIYVYKLCHLYIELYSYILYYFIKL